ncbi:putative quinol monooxygenase [Roseovarius ramblicola]|uniref:Quinol monooxygenase n=1 Tax=Roseovarius ramblicola TaxID=2022336 RepID=A0ABV5I1F2_9RHOB
MGVIRLTGTLTCARDDAHAVRAALPDHIRLSRAEPGCLSFDVTETAPGVFTVAERFADRAAFDAHQTRTRASAWWQATGHMARDFTLTEE